MPDKDPEEANTRLRVNLMPSLTAIEPMAWNACANPGEYPTLPLAREAGEGRDARQRVRGEGKRTADDLASPSPRSTPPGVESSSPDGTPVYPSSDSKSPSRVDPTWVGRGNPLPPYNPFVSHEFLLALEESGSATMETGWAPAHLIVETEDGVLLGVMPAYVKSHSQGEYVFDHAFADALERAGHDYYPKVQVSVPFTPAAGRRFLMRPGPEAERARLALAQGLLGLTGQLEASSAHITFMTREEQAFLTSSKLGFLPRTDIQFHWENACGWANFEDFLGSLASRKRKALKRERRDALANGISMEWITGKDITEAHWDAFWEFYQDTGSRKWGRPYLTRDFFSRVGAVMADRILLIFAMRGGRAVAGALNFIGGDTLFGRYWGCIEEHPFLHFETCYYQAVDFALQNGLKRVEAGAQGGHKLARGYRPVLTYSAHAFVHPGLQRAAEEFLKRERLDILHARRELDAEAPFRQDEDQE